MGVRSPTLKVSYASHPSFLTGARNYFFAKPTSRLTWTDTSPEAKGTIVPVVNVSSVVYCSFPIFAVTCTKYAL